MPTGEGTCDKALILPVSTREGISNKSRVLPVLIREGTSKAAAAACTEPVVIIL